MKINCTASKIGNYAPRRCANNNPCAYTLRTRSCPSEFQSIFCFFFINRSGRTVTRVVTEFFISYYPIQLLIFWNYFVSKFYTYITEN